MASGMSVYSAGLLLNKLLRSTDFDPGVSYWVAAFNNNASGGQLRLNQVANAYEVPATNSYARVWVRGGTGFSGGSGIHWSATDGNGSTNQSSDIVFTAASGSWGTIYAVALMTTETVGTGNVIVYSELSVPKPITAPDVLRIPINQFIINM